MSVTAARGFKTAATAAGIKSLDTLDLAVIVADQTVAAAAVFTSSATAAPPVIVSRSHVADGRARVVLLNAGCANAGTGSAGMDAAKATAVAAGAAYGCSPADVLLCSTGPIGPHLPVGRVLEALPVGDSLSSGPAAATEAARAIMTTDSHPKESVAAAGGYTVGGMAKGAGMVRPDMATMLAVITTDAALSPEDLDIATRTAVDRTFNRLNIDGCQSTNDTVIVLASGETGVEPAVGDFAGLLTTVCADLASQIARDAEGATRVVTIEVEGAGDDDTAARFGRIVADSDLVRSSFYGGDPNWGRVFAALGVAAMPIDPGQISIHYEGIQVAAGGVAVGYETAALSERMTGDFTVTVRVGEGPGRASILTTDLTPEYVRFNGEPS